MSFYISSKKTVREFDENRILTGFEDEIITIRVLSFNENGTTTETEMTIKLVSPQLEVLIDADGNVLVGP